MSSIIIDKLKFSLFYRGKIFYHEFPFIYYHIQSLRVSHQGFGRRCRGRNGPLNNLHLWEFGLWVWKSYLLRSPTLFVKIIQDVYIKYMNSNVL